MNTVYWNDKRKTSVSYNCVDRHLQTDEDREEEGLIWEGNYWDDNTHDCAELSWRTVETLVNKIGNLFRKYCEKGDRILLLLPNTIQLPLSLLGASRMGVKSVVMDPSSPSLAHHLPSVLSESSVSLIITVDGFWQGETLLETKKELDKVLEKTEVPTLRHVFVVRHTAPNDGVPPPEVHLPARRSCYKMEFPMTTDRDLEWSKLIRFADTVCPIEWVPAHHTFALLPSWDSSKLQLRAITTGQVLEAVHSISSKFPTESASPVLALGHPEVPFNLFSLLSPWFAGQSLVQFEGTLDYPDPARLSHLIKKYEIRTLVLSASPLDPHYLQLVPVPSLHTIVTTPQFHQQARSIFNNKKVVVADEKFTS